MTDATISMLVSQLGNAGARISSNKPEDLNKSGLPDFGNILSNAGKKNLEFKVEDRGASQSWMKKNEAGYSNTAVSKESSKEKAEAMFNAVSTSEVNGSSDETGDVTEVEPADEVVSDAYPHDEETAVEEMADCLVYLASQMMTILTEQLNVTEEQVNTALDKNGFLMTDLLDSSKLSEVFIELSGKNIEPVDVVSDESFKNLSNQFADIVKEVFPEGTIDISEIMTKSHDFVELGVIDKAFTEINVASQVESDDDSVLEVFDDSLVRTDDTSGSANNRVEDVIFDNDDVNNVAVVTENKTVGSNDRVKENLFDDVDSDENEEFNDEEIPDWFKSGDSDELKKLVEQFIKKHRHGALGLKDDDPIIINHNPTNEIPVGELPVVELNQVVNQLTEYIEVMSKDNKIQEISFQLNPANLGKVTVEVAIKDGVVSAKVIAQTEAAKNAIEANLSQLKTNLEQQGVRISDVEVTVESHAFEQNLQQQGSREQEQLAQEMQEETKKHFRSINGINLNELDLNGLRGLMSEEDMVVAKMMMDNGNVLNIKA